MKYAVLPLALLCVSCGSSLQRNIYVTAINTAQKEIDAVVVIDDEVYTDSTGKPALTPADVRLTFVPSAEDETGFRKIKLGVRSVILDENGNVTAGLDKDDSVPYFEDSRFIPHNDPSRQLFILRANIDYVP